MMGMNNPAPFLKIRDAVAVTGLSAYYLRSGCKDGSVPHITSGQTYYINIVELNVLAACDFNAKSHNSSLNLKLNVICRSRADSFDLKIFDVAVERDIKRANAVRLVNNVA